MKGLLIDENLPKSLSFNETSIHVTDLGARKTDTEIWQYAKDNDLVIVTKDTDFYDRIILQGAPPKVIWIRLGNLRGQHNCWYVRFRKNGKTLKSSASNFP